MWVIVLAFDAFAHSRPSIIQIHPLVKSSIFCQPLLKQPETQSISGKPSLGFPIEPDLNFFLLSYRLLDYFYTAFHQQHTDGTPVLQPLWFSYPKDANTFPIDLQFFFGDSVLVSPVTEENSTSVDIYLPEDIFYDFATLAPVEGSGSMVTLNDVDFTTIPLHIKGGAVLPLRNESASTTTALRQKDFEFVVAPGQDGTASGQLYIDDGESIEPSTTTFVTMKFANSTLDVEGEFGFDTGVNVSRVRFLNVQSVPGDVMVNGAPVDDSDVGYDATNKVLDVVVGVAFDSNLSVQYS
jgi:alpha-glucosidase